ncbi:MAG: hypothetical protein Q8K37_05520, partial [Alphaproteobacteria bacterium]|nr:hypothetical protein [Alphaproteobacteria bacterium]
MIKKLLFVTTLYLFSSNAFLAFSALYDDEVPNDVGSSSQSPILFDTSSFGFEKLKELIKSKTKNDKKAKIEIKKNEDQNAARIKKAIGLRLQKNNNDAETLFKKGAANGCPSSMYWLGFINEENRQDNQAFSWYMLSFFYQLIQSNNIQNELKKFENTFNKLNKLVEKDSFCQKRKAFYREIINKIINLKLVYFFLNQDCRHNFLVILRKPYGYFFEDKNLAAFWVNLILWHKDDIKTEES